MADSSRRRPLLPALLVLVAALLATAVATWWRPTVAPPPSVAYDPRFGVPPPRVTEVGRNVQTPTPSPAMTSTAGVGEVADAVGVAAATADEYRALARYPRWSRPLADGDDPILRDREVSPVVVGGADGAGPLLTVFPDEATYEVGETVRVHAVLSSAGQRIRAAEIEGEFLSASLERIGGLALRDDGIGGDITAGDGLYTAAFEPPPPAEDTLSASFLIRVRAVSPAGEERTAATSVLYSAPRARLTGTYSDREDEGDLVIEAEVEVRAAGRFHLEATLYDAGGRPLAWAQQAAALGAGRQRIALRYFGLVLRERGEDGPYPLRYAALSTVTAMPNAKNRLVESDYRTAAYSASGFSDKPFGDPGLLEAARRLEGSAR